MNDGKLRTVHPKKSLGQHFLHDKNVALKIVNALSPQKIKRSILEIGPGKGVLTQHLVSNEHFDFAVVEIDRDSVAYLKEHYKNLKIIEGDFLKLDLAAVYPASLSIIGNLPYNISSQILFKVFENKNQVDEVVCMLQKEVADRIAAPSGNKTYGILSVLLQAFYSIEFLFKVPPGVFHPPPKVMSAVIRLERNERMSLPCNEEYFVKVVKQGFNNRRKTLRNALKSLNLGTADDASGIRGVSGKVNSLDLLSKRAEQLTVDDFIYLTQQIEVDQSSAD